MKLTTADYHRPSGKNIHRFPDSKDGDDWGVIPNPGFEVKLGGKEMTQLIAQRRQKDIVHGNGEASPEAAEVAGFVDPQLRKAREYIEEQLKSQKPPEEPAAKEATKPELKPEEKTNAPKDDANKNEPEPQKQ